MSKRALIVVDIQNDYFPGGLWTLVGVEAAADNAAKLIAEFRKANDMIVHIRHEFPTSEAPFFRPGSEGAQTHAKVRALEGEITLLKHYPNSFRETELKAILDKHSIDELVICGNMSHICIDATTRAACDFGYQVTLIQDACASRDLEFNGTSVPATHVHAAYMAALNFAYAPTKSTADYLLAQKH